MQLWWWGVKIPSIEGMRGWPINIDGSGGEKFQKASLGSLAWVLGFGIV